MSFFRRDQHDQIEKELRSERPRPRQDFARQLASRIERQTPSRFGMRLRLGGAVALTAALAGVGASVGGATYAAHSATQVVKAVTHVVTPSKEARHESNAGGNSAAKHQYHKVKLCHEGHTIEVGEDAVPAHLAHGDTLGACPPPPPPEPPKAKMCHEDRTIEVSKDDVAMHLRKGDTLGACAPGTTKKH